jgi:hypothetical protein
MGLKLYPATQAIDGRVYHSFGHVQGLGAGVEPSEKVIRPPWMPIETCPYAEIVLVWDHPLLNTYGHQVMAIRGCVNDKWISLGFQQIIRPLYWTPMLPNPVGD